jgi:hypothetical protein
MRAIWLLENGASPDSIRWIMPRDAWLLNRASYQPGMEFFAAAAKSIADQLQSIAEATSVDDAFERLEACGDIRRIDPSVKPEAHHCAIISDHELAQLRRITNVVRMGRVERIEMDKIVLEQGSIPTGPNVLHIDCTAAGIPSVPTKKIFDGDRITLQWVRLCQPTLSAAFVGFVESAFDDEEVKNQICRPMVPPTLPVDWLRMWAVQLANQMENGKYPQIVEWQAKSRLDPFAGRIAALKGTEMDVMTHLGRYQQHIGPAAKKLQQLIATAG